MDAPVSTSFWEALKEYVSLTICCCDFSSPIFFKLLVLGLIQCDVMFGFRFLLKELLLSSIPLCIPRRAFKNNTFIHIRSLGKGGQVYAFPRWEESCLETLMLWSSVHGLDKFNQRKETWPQMDVATRREWSKLIKFIFIYGGIEIKFTRIKLKFLEVDWKQVHKTQCRSFETLSNGGEP